MERHNFRRFIEDGCRLWECIKCKKFFKKRSMHTQSCKGLEKKPTIAELEKILNSEEKDGIRILPNGQVVSCKRSKDKVLTLRENLGGEYAL